MTDSRFQQVVLNARTVSHLRPEQVVRRVRLRAQKVVLERAGDRLVGLLTRRVSARAWWPHGYVPLDRSLTSGGDDVRHGRFTFLGESRSLGEAGDWTQASASQLWRYHLHYWGWAWRLARDEDHLRARSDFRRLWHSWKAGTTFGRWDAWSPYVVAIRTWVLCGLHADLVAGSDWEDKYLRDVALHAGYVAANMEHDVGGNHLIKDIKALAGGGVFLDDVGLIRTAERALGRELEVQVLADGGHYERSPSYHCQVLGDLIDVAALLVVANRTPVVGLADAIERMRSWLGEIVMPDGTLPLLNDCTLVDPTRIADLSPPRSSTAPMSVLEQSGYVVVRIGPWHMVADVGAPCPPNLPAHAHADSLSFVLHVDGAPSIIDTGTSEYGSGPRRLYERSTAAHNTVEVDGSDSTEVFAAFRAARLARTTLEVADMPDPTTAVVIASHDGYRRLPGKVHHRRTWNVGPEELELRDELYGKGCHTAVGRLHSPSGWTVRGEVAHSGQIEVTVTGATPTAVAPGKEPLGTVSQEFGKILEAGCLEVSRVGYLPCTWSSVFVSRAGVLRSDPLLGRKAVR